jgi:acetyltransferase-like isoleucine patch superfamily enzyme
MDADQLADLLRALRRLREDELRKRFDRSLPFADGLFDRWERAGRLGFGEHASIYDSAFVFGDVRVGEGTWIGPYTLLDGSGGGLAIGAWCSISAGVQIYTHDTVKWALSGGKAARRTGAVSVGACTYIGSQSIVALGTKIGDHCVVAANSFVNAHVPPFTIVGGIPARRLGRVEITGDDIRLVYG